MEHSLDEQIDLAKLGMVEKGKEPLWLNLFRTGNQKLFDQTSIYTHSENQNTDNFRNL